MRRSLLVICCLLAACTAEPDGEPTTSSPSPITTVAVTTLPVPTSTTAAPASTTTAATTSTLSLDETVLAYQPVADLDFPVQLTARPGAAQSYVITKDGRVWLYDGDAVSDQPVLDIGDQVRNSGEQGLLSIALHPDDESRLYLHYSDGNGDTVVSEFSLTTPDQADPASERVLLQADQPAGNHNGGMVQFLPSGELLLGLGDGGGGGDQFGNGQNPDTLLGGLVVMDAAAADPGPAKYAMGLRNPWRFWIDGSTIYIADVGQNAYEEISVSEPLEPGRNYGWPIFEGLHCFSTPDCDGAGLVTPVIEVEHGDAGTCSITGGVVYRGPSIPQLDGHYFYSDYCGGYLRSFHHVEGEATEVRDWTEQVGVPGGVSGFGVDGAGEMYVTTTDQLLKVVSGG
ncbi:MAG TPA: PQQ-dependent sugar dehydrogenase [Acidimicrobiia bacterium]|nr:PQQ-dependent sugar dehydrogenase [Acidimicrobiia bacterium]